MNLAERLAAFMSQCDAAVSLADQGVHVLEPIGVSRWRRDAAALSASVTFGPYDRPVRATGVVVTIDEATDRIDFASPLELPPGATFTYDLRLTVG